MPTKNRLTPCLWFDNEAEDAARFYTKVFKNSKIGTISRYTEAGREAHGRPPGSVMTVAFELDGQPFTALNGGPVFKFNEAVSFMINCESQEEVD
jgi:predicted 3-demethylubiquinone-9 3-methyltransferase (glyoxalase superfamily)